MNVYLITWKFNKEESNYNIAQDALIEKIKNKYTWANDPGLDSVYFIASTLSTSNIYEDLSPLLEENDRIVITEMTRYFGNFNQGVHNWIKSFI